MDWARMLADITGTVDPELLLRNEYLATETRILKAQLKGRLLLSGQIEAVLIFAGLTVADPFLYWSRTGSTLDGSE
jgi:hypothetical protein